MPENDLKLLEEAAKEAGHIARRYFKADPEVRDKGDGQGPVTEADLAVNRMLHSDLLQARPDYGWLSEESTDTAARLERPRVFIVDPIDGTRAFIAGENTFAHSLAVAEDGEVVSAVVHLPMKGLTYSATRGGGAFLNGEPIRASEQPLMQQARALVTGATLKPDLWPGGVPDLTRKFRPSLAYRMCLVAEGRYDAMLTLRPTWEWDVAAGDLIACEAGARVTTPDAAAPRYNNPHPQLSGMVAAGGPLHRQFIERLQGASPDAGPRTGHDRTGRG